MLPEYFLADLQAPAALTPTMIREACSAVRSNRRRYLAGRNTDSTIAAVAAVAEDWLDPQNPYRRAALEQGPAQLGFPAEVLSAGLDAFFGNLTAGGLRALVRQDLGHPECLERLVPAEGEPAADRLTWARGPELLVHVTAGRLPNPAFTSMVLGLLLRSAQFVKCARGTSFLPRLFAHSLREVEPKLGACIEIAEWKGGTTSLESALFAQADCVTAMGTDATIAAIRAVVPAGTRFLGYGQRVSFGYVAHEALAGAGLEKVASACAEDVAAWNQLGCLSPHVIYAETGGRHAPERFAEALAEALARLETARPRGLLPTEDAASIASRRAFYEVRAALTRDTQLWCSPSSTAWTVVYDNDARFQLSCLNRFVHVKGVADLTQALKGVDEFQGRVSTVGLAATGSKEMELAEHIARWGATRICPVGQMQNPPLTWRHDGRPSLGDLVTFTDWEARSARW